MLKSFLYGFSCTLLVSPAALAVPLEDISAESDRYLQAQVTSVSELSDVGQTDWAYQALRSLVERYNCLAGYPDATYRGDRAMSRYEFAAIFKLCLDRITELIANSSDYVRREDLLTLQRLQKDFAAELANVEGRVYNLEMRTAALESQQFSTTTRLNAQFITAISDSLGNSVGNGVPSLFDSYNPLFRRGGGGAAANWEIVEDLTLTLGYLADNPNLPSEKNGLFNGGYNSLAHLYYLGDRGVIVHSPSKKAKES